MLRSVVVVFLNMKPIPNISINDDFLHAHTHSCTRRNVIIIHVLIVITLDAMYNYNPPPYIANYYTFATYVFHLDLLFCTINTVTMIQTNDALSQPRIFHLYLIN